MLLSHFPLHLPLHLQATPSNSCRCRHWQHTTTIITIQTHTHSMRRHVNNRTNTQLLTLKYHLGIGADRIPKRTPPTSTLHHRPLHTSPSPAPQPADDLSLAVQVGEDAYFLRDNAMGIADGVGGCSGSNNKRGHPAPSALFAKRLMHNCAIELALLLLLCLSLLCLLSLQTQTGTHGGPTHGHTHHPILPLHNNSPGDRTRRQTRTTLPRHRRLTTGLNRENNAASSTPSSQPCSYPSSLHCSTRLHTRELSLSLFPPSTLPFISLHQ